MTWAFPPCLRRRLRLEVRFWSGLLTKQPCRDSNPWLQPPCYTVILHPYWVFFPTLYPPGRIVEPQLNGRESEGRRRSFKDFICLRSTGRDWHTDVQCTHLILAQWLRDPVARSASSKWVKPLVGSTTRNTLQWTANASLTYCSLG